MSNTTPMATSRMELLQSGEFIAFQTTPATEGALPRKVKQYATRSKKGCTTCRRRHVRCDEIRPACQRCTKAQLSCIYSDETAASRAGATQSRPQAPLSVFRSPEELADLQFWIEVGGSNAGRWHCPMFYEHLLPQFSQAYDSARYSLLALSTCVRQWHLPDENARADTMRRGNHYYSLACARLLRIVDSKKSIETALVASLALFCYDSFTDNMNRRYIHTNAAISFLHLLKRGLSYNEVSGWRSDSGRVGAQIVIEAAEAYLDDISYSISKEYTNQAGTETDTTLPLRAKLYDPIWLQLDHQSAALTNNEILLKPDRIESPSRSWWVIQAAPRSMQDCHVYVTLWHNWLFTWLINTSIPADDLRDSQLLCRQWHIWLFGVTQPGLPEMLSMQNRSLILDELFKLKLVDQVEGHASSEIDRHLERILTLITSNIQISRWMSDPEDARSSSRFRRYGARQYLRGLAKVLEYVLRSANDPTIREQAYAVFSFQSLEGKVNE